MEPIDAPKGVVRNTPTTDQKIPILHVGWHGLLRVCTLAANEINRQRKQIANSAHKQGDGKAVLLGTRDSVTEWLR